MLPLIDIQFEKLACNQTQAFFSHGNWQLYHLLEWILEQTGESDIFISSFSVSEEFVRQLHRFRKLNMVNSISMLIDYRAARKALNMSIFISNVADVVYLGSNHSKIILVNNAYWKISVVTSQNQTRGNRYEAGVLSTEQTIFNKLYSEIESVKKECINGTELLTGSSIED